MIDVLKNEILENAILKERYHAVLIEGFTPEIYGEYVHWMTGIVKGRSGLILDFKDLSENLNTERISYKQENAYMEKAKKKGLVFSHGLELFADDINPKKATFAMNFLREINQSLDASGIYFARPDANLDFQSRDGFTYEDNHPLGNWLSAVFFIEEGHLVKKPGPRPSNQKGESYFTWKYGFIDGLIKYLESKGI